jgi:gas vesicle protein
LEGVDHPLSFYTGVPKMATKPWNAAREKERELLVNEWKKACEELKTAVEEYNDFVDNKLVTFRDEIAEAIDNFIEDHGEKWQEGEAGQAWEELKSEWENLTIERIDLEEDNPDSLAELDTEASA